jgi:hypothetical protein
MRTYFWIRLFTSYRITENYLIESNVIVTANKEFKKNMQGVARKSFTMVLLCG